MATQLNKYKRGVIENQVSVNIKDELHLVLYFKRSHEPKHDG